MSIFQPVGFTTPPLDGDAINFINASGISGQNEIFAINNLVVNLKYSGLWGKFLAIYPFVGGTADTHKYNLINPSQYTITFGGTVTHDSNGITGNGTDGYYDTGITTADISQDDNAHMIYIRTNVNEGKSDFGYFTADRGWQTTSRATDIHITRNYSNNAGRDFETNTNSIGLFSNTRTSSASYIKGKNKTYKTVTSTSLSYNPTPAIPILGTCLALGAATRGFYASKNYALTAVGNSGFTTAQISTFVDINQTFQTTLNRFV